MSDHKDDLTESQKWVVSFMSALAFLLIASPFMYKITGSVTDAVGFTTSVKGCPNVYGLVLHAIVFAVIVRLLMFVPVA